MQNRVKNPLSVEILGKTVTLLLPYVKGIAIKAAKASRRFLP
ncbi:hypothetical protein [Acinetobacter qingfengensis]|nr:hypothetical protein [Acinetobacter qingfengensis]